MYIKRNTGRHRRQRVELPASRVPQFETSLRSTADPIRQFQDMWKERGDKGGIDTYYVRNEILGLKSVQDAVKAGKRIDSVKVPYGYGRPDSSSPTTSDYRGEAERVYTSDMFKFHDYDNANWYRSPDKQKFEKLFRDANPPLSDNRMIESRWLKNETVEKYYGISTNEPGARARRPGTYTQGSSVGNPLREQFKVLDTWNQLVDNREKARGNLEVAKETRKKEINIFNRNLHVEARKQQQDATVSRRRRTGTRGHQIDLTGGAMVGLGRSGLKY